ncbi:hypothetical protein NQ314_002752 [Rhamnusium bicolor]|uniref:Cyclic nucleotide-binding domain-containing protein n=1 Tax=Rhamnusium bicolor TaxID=1586634 RepID=A0AAV8ZQS0_9CUCU|nr:hypothetical protein NQ314_002752 [Rhamnusium bicolor]
MTHKCKLKSEKEIGQDNETASCFKNLQLLITISAENPRRFQCFRSDVLVREEQQRHLDTYYYIIHPFSKFRAWYEIWLIFLYTSILITKPLDAGFFSYRFKDMTYYKAYAITFDILSWIDIGVTFITGFFNKESKSVQLRPSKIARNYVSSIYFICDVLSSMPKCALYLESTIFLINHEYFQIYGFVTIFNLFKIVRLVTLITCMHRAARYFYIKSKGFIFLLDSVTICALIIHWMACLQFCIPKLTHTYFYRTPLRSMDIWMYKNGFANSSMGKQYAHCVFRSSAYILGIRFQTHATMFPEDYIVAMFTYIVGKILVGFIWIILAMTILNSRSIEIKLMEMVNQVDEYMRQKQFPLNLKNRISQYYDFKYQKVYCKEKSIRNMLTRNIKTDINIHACKLLLSNVSLFSELSPTEVKQIVKYLVPEIYLPNDIIVKCGTSGDSMYFLSSGTVAVYARSGKEICHLQDGAYFGEISLILKGEKRTATVKAIETSQIYRLCRRDFERSLLNNRAVLRKIMKSAEKKTKGN